MCTSFAHALEQAGIPVQSPDETGYLKAREVGLLLDMLRVLDNPTLDTSLAAIMLSPMFWFTPEDLMRIRMLGKKTSLYSAVCMAIGVTESAEPVQLDDVLVQKCRQLYDTLQKLRQSSGMMTLEALIRRIYDTTDFLSVMATESVPICTCCCNMPNSTRRTRMRHTMEYPVSCGISTGCWTAETIFSRLR